MSPQDYSAAILHSVCEAFSKQYPNLVIAIDGDRAFFDVKGVRYEIRVNAKELSSNPQILLFNDVMKYFQGGK